MEKLRVKLVAFLNSLTREELIIVVQSWEGNRSINIATTSDDNLKALCHDSIIIEE